MQAGLVIAVIEALEAESIPYFLAGSIASMVYGIPRATKDVVIQKLRWGRAKDIADVETVIGVQGAKLDWTYIERWCDAHGSRKRLDEVKASIPPDLLESSEPMDPSLTP